MGTTLRKTHVLRFSPSTASDTLDANDAPSGACSTITNLIPDPSTRGVWVAKPTAGITNTMQNGATPNPGTISVFLVVGTFVYGLIENTVSGTETPFCIDASSSPNSGAAIQVQNGFSTTFQPQTLSLAGTPWLPTMALIGNTIIVTHPGFATVSGAMFGTFDLSNPGFPVWSTNNLRSTGGIVASHISAGGTGYDSGGTGTSTTPLTLTGGSGSGATAIVHFVAGVCTWAVITGHGSSYVVGDTLGIPGFFGGTGGVITVDAVQTTGAIILTTIPQWVAQFYQRAWFGVNPSDGSVPSVVFTDILSIACTNANQALTFGDNIPTTAAAGLGLNNQLGGVIQALIIFKSVSYILQITGDASLTTLAINALNVATGTTSARGVTATPQGLAFASPDGLRIISFDATVSDPIGAGGQGVTLPFTYGVEPFPVFVAMGCNRGVIRASLKYQYPNGSVVQNEFWFDLTLKVWSGPHTTAYWEYSNYKDTWLAFRGDLAAHQLTKLLTILSYPGINAAYAPDASCELTTAVLMPAEAAMSQIEIVELQVMTSAPAQVLTMVVRILDQDGNVVVNPTFTFSPSTAPTTSQLYPRRISFAKPAVVTRFSVDVQVTTPVTGLAGFQIGAIYIRYRELGYLQELPG